VAKAFADLAGSEELRRAAYLLRTQSIEMVDAAGDHSREKVKNYTDFTMLDAIYGTYLDQDDIGTIVIVTGDASFFQRGGPPSSPLQEEHRGGWYSSFYQPRALSKRLGSAGTGNRCRCLAW